MKSNSNGGVPSRQPHKLGPELDFATAEAYKLLRTNISFSIPNKATGRIIGLTSPRPQDGKSFSSVNLAYSLAEAGHQVVLIDGDMLISAMAIALKNEGRLTENKVVVTKLTNLGFHHCMKAAEIEVPVTDVGDRYVLEEMLRCGSVIGGEQSGHVILLDYATTGDGQITASMALRLLASQSTKTASQVFGVMTRLPQVSLNVPVPNARKKEVMTNERVLEKKTAIEEALADSGRILLRPSGTEALIRIMLEGSDTDALLAQANELKAVILEILG
jgi:phosphoglucosamine mutase